MTVGHPESGGEPRPSTPAGAGDATAAYHKLLERVPAILYVADQGADGCWHYVSPQIEAILGFSPEEWCADPTLWAARLHPDDRARVITEEAQSVAKAPDASATEYRMLDRDGNVVWIRDDSLLIRDQGGRPRWHGVLSDITERKAVEAELEQRAAQQAAVARLGERALEGVPIEELMQDSVTGAAHILDVELGAVLELQGENGAFVLRAGIGWPRSAIGAVVANSERPSQAAYTILSGRPVMVTDWDRERRFDQSAVLKDLGTRSGLTVQIEGRAGPFGILGVQAMQTRDWRDGDVDFLQSLANVLADALERQATEDAIRHRALHDPLTTLPNRVLFLDRLDHALARLQRRPGMAAILFLDLDRFKLVNDSLGHHVGDELLAAAAPRLKQAVRSSDTVARFGGDEFGILLEDISGEQDATEMAERIAAVFARPFVLAGNEHFVTTSIGIAIAQGGEVPEELIRDADAAMYRAKEHGRARYELFDEVMRGRAIARLRVENDLRRALERNELRLEYQPIVSLRNRAIVSVEALLRWDHPERGSIPPSEFIPLAEEDGLIEPIGRWVLETACRQGAEWHRLLPDRAPVSVSVNISPVQIARPRLPELVAEVLRACAFDAAYLSLEITESVMLKEAAGLTEVLAALKAIGVRLVLDDFGTGYSSLGYLTHLPLDALKVDRSFVDGLGTEERDSAITEAIIAMSHALSFEVIGEGVETPLQLTELSQLRCDLAQGYYFSRSVRPNEITQMLRDAPHAALKPACQG